MTKQTKLSAWAVLPGDVVSATMPDETKTRYTVTKNTAQVDGLVCLETTTGQDLYYRYAAQVEVVVK